MSSPSSIPPQPSPAPTKARPHDNAGWINRSASMSTTTLLRKLLRADLDVNSVTTDGETPLMAAADAGQLSCLKILLENGANVHLVNTAGATALDLAISGKQDPDCVRTILEYGADPNCVNFYKLTPLLTGIIKHLCWADTLKFPLTSGQISGFNYRNQKISYILMQLINHGADVLACPGTNAKIPIDQCAAQAIIQHRDYFTNDLVGLCQLRHEHHLLSVEVQELSASKNDPGRKTKL